MKILLLFFWLFNKTYTQQESVSIRINQSIFNNNSKVEYEIINKTDRIISFYVGTEILIDNEWKYFIEDVTINPIKRKARILYLKPQEIFSNKCLIDDLLLNDFERFKKYKFRLVLKYTNNKKHKNWKKKYSDVFNLE